MFVIAYEDGLDELLQYLILIAFVAAFYFAIAYTSAAEAAARGPDEVAWYRFGLIRGNFLVSFVELTMAFTVAPPRHFNKHFLRITMVWMTIFLLNGVALLREKFG